jgi:predicted anti-sigma-YlaC factor YlaD
MTCQELDTHLDDWLDGALPPSAAAEVEAHLAACDACHEAARRLRQVLAHAKALPGSVAPPRDLWPGIQSRIAHPSGWSRFFTWDSPALLAAAAAVVVGLLAVVFVHRSPGTVRTVEIPVASPATLERASAGAAVEDPVLAQAERDYEAAANALLAALQQRRRALTPETIAGVQQNLQVIDRALVEVRQALAKDPHNPELNRMLVATHRKKVDVLQRVVRLSTTL